MAGRTGAEVVGSYDPRRTGVGTLDFFDERHEQVLARPEVVQQHSMAGADRAGHVAQ